MGSEQNKAIVRQFIEEAQGRGRMSAVDEFLSSDFVDRSAPAGVPSDRNSAKIQFSKLRAAFPDLEVIFDDLIAEDNKVVVCKTMRGTHLGEYLGVAATGKAIAFKSINILRVADSKIVEHWNLTDQAGLMRQLGLIPTPTTA